MPRKSAEQDDNNNQPQSKPSTRKPGRPSRDASPVAPDEVLLQLAFETFAELGFESTALRDLCRRLGVSHNLIHSRFGSKDALWLRAVDYCLTQHSQEAFQVFIDDYPSDEARLRALVVSFTESAAANPAVVGLIHHEGRRDSWRLEHLYQAFVAPFSRQLAALLERLACTHGRMPMSTATFMVLMVHGIGSYFVLYPLIRKLGFPEKLSLEEVRRQGEIFAEVMLTAVTQHS
ncbi:TetR/AcrR family transcriptional regulator [Pseudomonas sp. NBRC 100443]|uniref:TetR/AcrR family transcriptional regulator n=1 Tax=Pseudomonas sp. NBRC 100443 TaxID=1113665 RepID=UPI00249FC49D|nr:TetR/AcrR family transcriptional regulator [Pseudomonas sp. NBRC 100443]GLU37337.1 putative transcriptional regulator, TetR [Pseudomonas sp. NBRC 100443]